MAGTGHFMRGWDYLSFPGAAKVTSGDGDWSPQRLRGRAKRSAGDLLTGAALPKMFLRSATDGSPDPGARAKPLDDQHLEDHGLKREDFVFATLRTQKQQQQRSPVIEQNQQQTEQQSRTTTPSLIRKHFGQQRVAPELPRADIDHDQNGTRIFVENRQKVDDDREQVDVQQPAFRLRRRAYNIDSVERSHNSKKKMTHHHGGSGTGDDNYNKVLDERYNFKSHAVSEAGGDEYATKNGAPLLPRGGGGVHDAHIGGGLQNDEDIQIGRHTKQRGDIIKNGVGGQGHQNTQVIALTSAMMSKRTSTSSTTGRLDPPSAFFQRELVLERNSAHRYADSPELDQVRSAAAEICTKLNEKMHPLGKYCPREQNSFHNWMVSADNEARSGLRKATSGKPPLPDRAGEYFDWGNCPPAGSSVSSTDTTACLVEKRAIAAAVWAPKRLATETLLQQLLWKYFASQRDPSQPDENCVPFVSFLAIGKDPNRGSILAYIVTEKTMPLPKKTFKNGNFQLLYDMTDADTLTRRAKKAKECLSIMNQKIGVTHGHFNQGSVQLHPETGGLRLIDFGASTAWWMDEDPKTGGRLDLIAGRYSEREEYYQGSTYMHPNLIGIPSCAQQEQRGYANPPNVGLHIDLYALAVSLVQDCFFTIGKGGIILRIFADAIEFGLSFKGLARKPFLVETYKSYKDQPALQHEVAEFGKLPYDKRDPNPGTNCHVQAQLRSNMAENEGGTGPHAPSECICYNGFERKRIAKLFEIGAKENQAQMTGIFGVPRTRIGKALAWMWDGSSIRGTKAQWEALGEFVARCLDFTAMLVPIHGIDKLGGPGSLGEKLEYQYLAPFARTEGTKFAQSKPIAVGGGSQDGGSQDGGMQPAEAGAGALKASDVPAASGAGADAGPPRMEEKALGTKPAQGVPIAPMAKGGGYPESVQLPAEAGAGAGALKASDAAAPPNAAPTEGGADRPEPAQDEAIAAKAKTAGACC
ncbi:unnamed protein product [Amoebophrya sp. A25]|nr:unnamed protein product [Amoebophrya sp. A25]|eukprot:GSA25T00010567001.1